MATTMMNMHEETPFSFSVAVALPTYLKSLFERMLHGLLREQPLHAARWRLSNATDTDVTFKLHGDEEQAISPTLRAEVRCRDGRSETIVIEGAWRTGAMTAALDNIASIIIERGAARATPTLTLARQWLQRWSDLRSQSETDEVVLTIGGRQIANIDLRSVTASYAASEARTDPTTLITAMARDGWALAPARGKSKESEPRVSLKPLLWQLGLHSGESGAVPALRAADRLRLKGWPYLAAGGHPSYAELIKHLRNGDNNRQSLQALNLAPPTIVDGFLNACSVCEFFHDCSATVGTRTTPPPASAPRSGTGDQLVISAIRRTLGIARP
ncbi:MAG: hypothetical protein JNN30_01775 [Rhodanobacteraceae bacterium]|nr:hypothetical protein [Rhodanobacteraceae bacterium]